MNINKNTEYPSPATVWGLYHLLPECVYLRIEVISEPDNQIVESLTFMKNDEMQRKDGEKQMYSLLGRYSRYGHYSRHYSRINFDWRYGFGSDATIQIVVD